MAAAGASLPIIGKGLGHKDVSTTANLCPPQSRPSAEVHGESTGEMFSAGNLAAKNKVTKLRKAG
jgi:hypothetical protein